MSTLRLYKVPGALAALTIAGLLTFAAPRPAAAQCPTTFETCGIFVEEQFCEECPGFSTCVCLYQGAECPSATISCNRFEVFVSDERGYIVWMWETYCYLRKGCRSEKGGPCGVYPWGRNLCVDDGGWIEGPPMWDVDVLEDCPCG